MSVTWAFGSLLLLATGLALPVLLIFLIFALVKHGSRSSKNAKLDDEELRTLTDLAEGLEGMEERIANLETILMNHARDAQAEREAIEKS